MLDGVASGSAARGNLDFAVDRGQVGIDRTGTDDQASGDLLICQSLSQQLQHLHVQERMSKVE